MALAPITEIGGRRLLFVMAVDAEYGRHLKRRFTPLMTGVGPVEAGVRLGAELALLSEQGALPDFVVSLGSAGSRTLEQMAVYQASSVAYRDMDVSALGFERGATPFLDLPATVPLGHAIPGVRQASLSTGAAVVSGAAYDAIAADMVDMETFAVLRACQLFGVDMIGLRGISDGAVDLKHVDDWRQYLHIIDEKLAAGVDRLEVTIAEGTIVPPPSKSGIPFLIERRLPFRG